MTPPAPGAGGHEAPDRGHDLRLVAAAVAAWLTTFALIAAEPWVCYAFAGGCALLAAGLLAAHGSGARSGRRRGRGRAAWYGAGRLGVARVRVARVRAARPRPACFGAVARRRALAGAVLACAAAAGLGIGLRLSAVGSGPIRALADAGAQATIDAVITGDPQVRPGGGGEIVTVAARAESVRARAGWCRVRVPVLVLARGPSAAAWQRLSPSRRVRLTARLVPPERAELLAAVALVRGPPIGIGPPSVVQRAAGTVRAKLREATDGLPAEQQGVLPGMVVGDTSRLDPGLAADFRAAGLTHVLVVSGANLAIVIGAVLVVARAVGLGRRGAPLVAALAVVAFVVVARPEPSVLRATVMGLIGLLALVTGRRRQGVPALAGAVLGLVLIDPELARSYGFALSVLATLGLLVLAPPWRDRLSRRMPRPIAEVLAVAAAAEVACAPVVVMLSGEISLVAVAANLLAAPAIAPATLFGGLTALVAPVAMAPARLLAWPAGLAVGWIVAVARAAAGVPHATVQWHDGALGAAALLLVVALAGFVLRRRWWRRAAAAACAGLIVMIVSVRVIAPGWPPRGWLLVACDVGQGDALALTAGPHRAVVVDAGPDPRPIDRCLSDLDVEEVPLLVLTHPHADHIDGVPGVLHGRAVGTVVPSPLSEGQERRLIPGRTVRTAAPGQRWAAGTLTLSVLAPSPAGPHVSTRDPGTEVNNASVVLVARFPGLTALLPGDLETEAQRALAPIVPAVDLVKVPHHGSSRQDPGFIAATHARIAITSVGAGNDYGHPAPVTVALLRRLGIREYRTDLDGDIAVLRTGGWLTVVTRGT